MESTVAVVSTHGVQNPQTFRLGRLPVVTDASYFTPVLIRSSSQTDR